MRNDQLIERELTRTIRIVKIYYVTERNKKQKESFKVKSRIGIYYDLTSDEITDSTAIDNKRCEMNKKEIELKTLVYIGGGGGGDGRRRW